MKTWLSWIIVLVLSSLLASCGEEKKPEPKPDVMVDESPKEEVKKGDATKEKPPAETLPPADEKKKAGTPVARASGQPATLHGELVDLIGFISGAQQDADAVRKSARAGNPIGFFETGARKLYVVGLPQVNAGANESLLPYLGLRVFITGKTYAKDGVDVIIMSDIGKSIK